MMFSEIVQKEAQEMREEGRAEGIEEGQQKKAIETAKNMFKLNLTVQQIADCTGLPCAQVEELQKEMVAMPAK